MKPFSNPISRHKAHIAGIKSTFFPVFGDISDESAEALIKEIKGGITLTSIQGQGRVAMSGKVYSNE